MIAVVGHADLAPWTLALLEEELRTRLGRCAEAGRTGLVRVGQGLPLAFGRAAKQAGLALVAVVPTLNRVPALLRERDRRGTAAPVATGPAGGIRPGGPERVRPHR